MALTILGIAQFGGIDVNFLSSVHGYELRRRSRLVQHNEPGTGQSDRGAAGSCCSVMRVRRFAASLGASEVEENEILFK